MSGIVMRGEGGILLFISMIILLLVRISFSRVSRPFVSSGNLFCVINVVQIQRVLSG